MNFPAGGPIGVVNGDFTEITEDLLAPYRNQGGFDIIGTGRDKVLAER
jgi:pyrophosphate--fructose-6-phosphate 1-phosphotransferase